MSESSESPKVQLNQYGELPGKEPGKFESLKAMARWTGQMIRTGEYLHHIPVIRSIVRPKFPDNNDLKERLDRQPQGLTVDKEGNLIPKEPTT